MITEVALEIARELLHAREGEKRNSNGKHIAYLDSLGFLTGGYGHRIRVGDGYKKGEEIPDEVANEWFENDIRWALHAAQYQAKELGIHCAEFLAALISVNFQLGTKWHFPKVNGGKGFVQTYDHIKAKRFDRAIHNLRKSAWYKQTPVRVEDFIRAIEYVQQMCKGI